MPAYYNENDLKTAGWLRELIREGLVADGEVDTRSIVDVEPSDLAGFVQCHFFAGIGGWSLALRIAGWRDDRTVWSGSCPCQPFSSAGAQAGGHDSRDLWPTWFHLIAQCHPSIVFGEQVEAAIGHGWLDRLHVDLEGEGYAVAPVGLPSACAGAFDIRQRVWFVADTDEAGRREQRRAGLSADIDSSCRHDVDGRRQEGWLGDPEDQRRGRPASRGRAPRRRVEHAERVGYTEQSRSQGWGLDKLPERAGECTARPSSDVGSVGQSDSKREAPIGRISGRPSLERSGSAWAAADWLPCRDGKSRPVEPGTFPLAHGVPARVGRLRGYGNAINPWVAAEVIGAYMDIQ